MSRESRYGEGLEILREMVEAKDHADHCGAPSSSGPHVIECRCWKGKAEAFLDAAGSENAAHPFALRVLNLTVGSFSDSEAHKQLALLHREASEMLKKLRAERQGE